MGVSIFSFHRTLADSQEFRDCLAQVTEVLSQNVAAALYRAAMEGSVTAQSFWLKSRPPLAWTAGSESVPQTGAYDELSDHELIDLARAMGLDIPPEIEAKARTPGG